MAHITQTKQGARLGTRFRGKLAAAYGGRGHALCGLWYVYSPKTGRDWVLQGDLAFDHFVGVESDSSIVDADYGPEPATFSDAEGPITVPRTAIVSFAGGEVEWRILRAAGSEPGPEQDRAFKLCQARLAAAGIRYRLITEPEVRAAPMLLANWRRILVWIAAARESPMQAISDRVDALLRKQGALTLRELETYAGEANFPLYAAALFKMLQSGLLQADLTSSALQPATRFAIRGQSA